MGRKCGDCDLGMNGLCKAAEKKKVLEARRIKEQVQVEGNEVAVKRDEIVERVVVKKEAVSEQWQM